MQLRLSWKRGELNQLTIDEVRALAAPGVSLLFSSSGAAIPPTMTRRAVAVRREVNRPRARNSPMRQSAGRQSYMIMMVITLLLIPGCTVMVCEPMVPDVKCVEVP